MREDLRHATLQNPRQHYRYLQSIFQTFKDIWCNVFATRIMDFIHVGGSRAWPIGDDLSPKIKTPKSFPETQLGRAGIIVRLIVLCHSKMSNDNVIYPFPEGESISCEWSFLFISGRPELIDAGGRFSHKADQGILASHECWIHNMESDSPKFCNSQS